MSSHDAWQPTRHQIDLHTLVVSVLVLLLSAALGYWIVASPETSTANLSNEATTGSSADQRIEDPREYGHSHPRGIDLPKTASPETYTRLTGFEILRVALTGSGGIIDVRYRAVDERTANLHAEHNHHAAIIDMRSGTHLTTQWMGHAHPPHSYQPDRNYWMLIRNPNSLVQRGDRVAVMLGHGTLTDVRVK